MPKNKLPRQSTHVDMTAMCDVAFLLLTFFMLATKFKPDEPVVVSTPSSISEIPIPDNTILLTMNPEGLVFFGYDNQDAKKLMIADINKSRQLGLSPQEMDDFAFSASYGSPLEELKSYLATPSIDRKKFPFKGVPVNEESASIEENELVYWVQSARTFGQQINGKAPFISIKADSKTPYKKVKAVLDALIDNDIDRFNLITSAEAVPVGTAAYENQMSGNGG